MREIKKRWLSDTPMFFKKLIHAGIVVGLVGGALITLPALSAVTFTLVFIIVFFEKTKDNKKTNRVKNRTKKY